MLLIAPQAILYSASFLTQFKNACLGNDATWSGPGIPASMNNEDNPFRHVYKLVSST